MPGGATDWSRLRGVDEVARDHALVRGAERDRRLAGQDAGARLDAVAQARHRVDQLERGADRALGVVLVRDRRAPDGHDRVADELLDRAAVALDDLAREVEVARQRVADVLRVALLGERREADEVGEQDADELALRAALAGVPAPARRWPPDWPLPPEPSPSAASRIRAELGARDWLASRSSGRRSPAALAHSMQNFAPAMFSVPQLGQITP